jgi:hypothetical protein
LTAQAQKSPLAPLGTVRLLEAQMVILGIVLIVPDCRSQA